MWKSLRGVIWFSLCAVLIAKVMLVNMYGKYIVFIFLLFLDQLFMYMILGPGGNYSEDIPIDDVDDDDDEVESETWILIIRCN